MRKFIIGLFGVVLALPFVAAQEKKDIPAGSAVTITVTQATPPAPACSITLNERHGHVVPHVKGCTHTGGGYIDVQSPTGDVVTVTMTGACIADSSMDFDLDQAFEVSFDKAGLKKAKVSVEGRVIGVLRGGKGSCAEYCNACASIVGPEEVVTVCVPSHQTCDCENLSINDHDGPKSAPIKAAKYTLHQTFGISAHGGCALAKKASAEFSDAALDPLWLSYKEPFHGVSKKDFGFQVTIKVAEDTDEAPAAEKKPEEVAPPKEEKKEEMKEAPKEAPKAEEKK